MPVAIVTGASRGLGLALTAALANQSWQVVVDGRDANRLKEAVGSVAGDVIPVPGDITDADHRAALLAEVEGLGGLDLLVNNAGILGPSPQPSLAAYPIDVLRVVYDVNVIAPLALAQLTLPLLRKRFGAIINITSDASVEAYEGWGGYGSAKAAIDHASRVLGAEESDIRVWAVDPGDLRTQMHQEAFPGEDISDRPLPESVVPGFLRLIEGRPPSGRVRAADFVPA